MSGGARGAPPFLPPPAVGMGLIARWLLRRETHTVHVEGLEHVPREGPVLIAARHEHHLLDGTILVRYVPRPVHIVVALDWTADAAQRRRMEWLCAWARWPVILRPATIGSAGGFAADELARYLRSGVRDAAELLREGRVVVVFPEGYPLIDAAGKPPPPSPRDAAGFLPFADGFRRIAAIAERSGARDIALVPLGFTYTATPQGWNLQARFGPPLPATTSAPDVEAAVRALST